MCIPAYRVLEFNQYNVCMCLESYLVQGAMYDEDVRTMYLLCVQKL